MESSAIRQKVLSDFQNAHDEYLKALCEYVNPEERKPLIEDSLKAYRKRVNELQTGECSVADVMNDISAIKDAQASVTYIRGECSPDCLSSLLRAQDLALAQTITTSKIASDQKNVIMVGVLELTNELVAAAFRDILRAASAPSPAWEVRDKCHEVMRSATKLILQLVDSIREGTVTATSIPSPDKNKYKEFLN